MYYKQKAVYGTYIPEEECPVAAGLRIERKSDPDYGLTEDEIADRSEFIRCYLAREFELLMMIPAKAEANDFFIADFPVADAGYSAFDTFDFQRTQTPFDKYGYAMKKIMERVMELAILYSAVSADGGRQTINRRYHALVELEFREPLFRCVDRYRAAKTDEQRQKLKQKIGELNRRIIEARKTWERHASNCS